MENAITKPLELMLLGMVGIFVVLILIYFVIVTLNKLTNKPTEKVKVESEVREKDESVSTVDDTKDETVCAIVQSVICEELHVEPNKIKIIEIIEK